MPLLFLAFTVLPFVELFLLIRVGRVIGPASTLAFVVLMGILGAMLAKSQGRKVLLAWQESLAAGRVPEEGVLGGVLVLVGGLLLILPGLISDVLGLLCLIPLSRHAIARSLGSYLGRKVAVSQIHVQGSDFGFSRGMGPRVQRDVRATRPSSLRGDIIDTEGEEVSSRPVDQD